MDLQIPFKQMSKNNILFLKYKNEIKNMNKSKKDYLFYQNLNKIITNANENQNNKASNITWANSMKSFKNCNITPLNLKKNYLRRSLKDINEKPKFSSELCCLKYYLSFSKPGIGKKTLHNIYEDLDKIQNKITSYEQIEENKSNKVNEKNASRDYINEYKKIINTPQFSHRKRYINTFISLCGRNEKYKHEFSKIKNLFGTRSNLFEKREIIKNMIKENDLNNKSINIFSVPNKKIKLYFPSINNKRKKNKSFNKNKLKGKSLSKTNFGSNLFNLNMINKMKINTMIDKLLFNKMKSINSKKNDSLNENKSKLDRDLESIDNLVKELYKNNDYEKKFEKNKKEILEKILK
jgi:hypothetical protein